MSNLSVSSPAPTAPSSITDKGSQQDVSTDQGALQSPEQSQFTKSISFEDKIPAPLQGSYDSSSAVIEPPQLQLTQQDMASLSLLSHQSLSPNGTLAVNNSTASAVLAVFEVYLQNQQKIEDEYTNPGAPHQSVTSAYQQEIVESNASGSLPFVAATALSVQQSVSEDVSKGSTEKGPSLAEGNFHAGQGEMPLLEHAQRKSGSTSLLLNQISTLFNRGVDNRNIGRNNNIISHHSNIVGSHGNIVGPDSRHNVVRKLTVLEEKKNQPTDPIYKPTSTATYNDNESLDALRKNLSEISTMNNLASIEEQDDRTSQQRSEQEKGMLNKASSNKASPHLNMGSEGPARASSHTTFTSDQLFVEGNIAGLSAGAIDTNPSIAAELGGQQAASVNQSNFALALQNGLKTLSEVTKPLRQQPIKAG